MGEDEAPGSVAPHASPEHRAVSFARRKPDREADFELIVRALLDGLHARLLGKPSRRGASDSP